MNTKVCVNCQNEKPVNLTNNRLVTESCGHVKCMDCLLQEKTGCLACITVRTKQESNDGFETEEGLSRVSEGVLDEVYDVGNANSSPDVYENLSKKKKPETSHIRIETDAKGRCYVCTLCDKRFHARSQVAYHAYCNGQRKPYHCLECKTSYATHSHYKYHMRVHRNERPYACDVCGDSFIQMSKLQRHKLKHTKEKKYACTQCNKAFNNVTSLRKHGLTHTEERPYECKVCGRRFRDGSNYSKHVAKHKEKKCKCGRCAGAGAGAGSEGGAGVGGCGACGARAQARAHQCPRCPQAFHSSKDMRRHAAVHTDSKPFRCKVCNRRFRRKDNLERHIRNTHPDYVTASAVECDETALKQIATNGHQRTPDAENETTKLETLNPPPALPQEAAQTHTHGTPADETDKSYILVANNARQSVIVGKWTAKVDKAPSPPVCEYVHKIRKANSMASQNNISLPPIDEKKVLKLKERDLDNFEAGTPPKDMKKLLRMILYDDAEKKESEAEMGVEKH